MNSAKTFWQWFEKNQAKYFFLNQKDNDEEKDKLLDEFSEQLHRYSDQLFFEIGGFPDEPQDLIITADGNTLYFQKVEELVNSAPTIKDWNIIAFKPPKEFGFITDYEGISLNPHEIWFLPLQLKNGAGLRVYLNEFNIEKEQGYLFATSIVLDNILGEKLNAEYVRAFGD